MHFFFFWVESKLSKQTKKKITHKDVKKFGLYIFGSSKKWKKKINTIMAYFIREEINPNIESWAGKFAQKTCCTREVSGGRSPL